MKNLKIFFVIVFSFFNFVLQAQNIGKPSPIDTKGMSSSDYLAFLQKSNPKSFIVAGKNFENAVPNQMITATENKTLKGTYNFTFFFSEKELFATVITKISDIGNPNVEPIAERTKDQHDKAMSGCNFNWLCMAVEWGNTIRGCEGSGGNCVHCFYDSGCR